MYELPRGHGRGRTTVPQGHEPHRKKHPPPRLPPSPCPSRLASYRTLRREWTRLGHLTLGDTHPTPCTQGRDGGCHEGGGLCSELQTPDAQERTQAPGPSLLGAHSPGPSRHGFGATAALLLTGQVGLKPQDPGAPLRLGPREPLTVGDVQLVADG